MNEEISHDYNVPAKQREIEREIALQIRAQNRFKVLDVCCRRFPRGFGVDKHPESNADLLCDAHILTPIGDDSFDLALCVEGIEHLANPTQAVQEWARVSKYALAITTQNAHCWRRWIGFPKLIHPKPCTSPDHIYMWDEYTFANFFRKALPKAHVSIEWYDRYLKKSRHLRPRRFFRENIFAFVWLNKEQSYTRQEITHPSRFYAPLYYQVYDEAKRLINMRPEHDVEYKDRPSEKLIRGIGKAERSSLHS